MIATLLLAIPGAAMMLAGVWCLAQAEREERSGRARICCAIAFTLMLCAAGHVWAVSDALDSRDTCMSLLRTAGVTP